MGPPLLLLRRRRNEAAPARNASTPATAAVSRAALDRLMAHLLGVAPREPTSILLLSGGPVKRQSRGFVMCLAGIEPARHSAGRRPRDTGGLHPIGGVARPCYGRRAQEGPAWRSSAPDSAGSSASSWRSA